MPRRQSALIEVSIEPKTKTDREKLDAALQQLIAEDSLFAVATDFESGQTILRGVSEAHLEEKIDRLRGTCKINANVGALQVAYRETIGRRAEIDYTHKKLIGSSGQFAKIRMVFEPGARGSGFKFESQVTSARVLKKYVPGVRKGIEEAKGNGLIAGFPVIDFKAVLTDGAYHDLDSSVLAFEIAARAAFRELHDKADPILLEPIMKVEVVAPEVCVGDVISDLGSRQGQIGGQKVRRHAVAVTAMVPLGNMFGYVSTLRGLTQGRAKFTMRNSHYAPVPRPDDDPDLFPPAAAMRA